MSFTNSKPLAAAAARRAASRARTGRGRRSASCACRRLRRCLRMVSRYATCGLPTLAPTLNSRCMRSTMISRCNSPMPARMVCPVSGSVETWSVGSSCTSFGDRHAQLFLIGLGLGLDRQLDHRRREVDRFQNDRDLLVADRVAGRDRLQAHRGADVARQNFRDLLALVGVHLAPGGRCAPCGPWPRCRPSRPRCSVPE